MPSRYTQRNYQPNSYYHIFNRGAHKHKIFQDEADYLAFTDIMAYFLYPTGLALSQYPKYSRPETLEQNFTPPTYQLLCYCLMPNHFHLLLHQLHPPQPDNSISSFMKRLNTTYVHYYNLRHSHSGSLYQGKYKNVPINTEAQLLQLSKYIHKNPVHNDFEHYPYSSYSDFVSNTPRTWLNPKPILD